jgi:hypothetical protein
MHDNSEDVWLKHMDDQGLRIHHLVQHRDLRPPWCNTCRRTADGTVVPDKVTLRPSIPPR